MEGDGNEGREIDSGVPQKGKELRKLRVDEMKAEGLTEGENIYREKEMIYKPNKQVGKF